MAKTEEHIYSIREQCEGKLPSDQSNLQDEFILHIMNNVRSTLVPDYFNQRRQQDSSFYQLSCCVPVECENIICDGIDSQEKLMFAKLPKLIEGIGWKNILYFGNAEIGKIYKGLENNFDRLSFEGFLSKEYCEYTGRRPAYTVIGGIVIGDNRYDGDVALIKNIPTSGGKYLCVNGIFANPQEGLCNDEDIMKKEYPIPSNIGHKLEMLSIQQILSTGGTIGDELNNARDNTSNVSIQQPERREDE